MLRGVVCTTLSTLAHNASNVVTGLRAYGVDHPFVCNRARIHQTPAQCMFHLLFFKSEPNLSYRARVCSDASSTNEALILLIPSIACGQRKKILMRFALALL